MILVDRRLLALRESLIIPFVEARVSNICYDLTTDRYYKGPNADQGETSVELQPGDSVFVRTKEAIYLPGNIAATIVLRNRRIRQGLSLTAPVYQPGHKTKVFFRITNASAQAIRLTAEDDLASIIFEELTEAPQSPYSGEFQQEMDFSGMGSFTVEYSKQMQDVQKKVDEVKSIEKDLYTNVLSLMAIFVGIFSLINVNVTLVSSQTSMPTLLTFNFATVGAIGFLIALAGTIINHSKNRKAAWFASGIAFTLAILMQFIPS